jgi:uncharacterized membrane protein YphA (DoxX/SURF4 family)
MTTLYSTRATLDREVADVTNGQVVLWVAQLVIGATFFMSGGAKFAGAPAMIALFDAIGIGQWFRYVTATIEVASGLALLVPRVAPYAALVLAITMLCAVATHLLIGGSPLPALVLLAGSIAIAWARRDQF